MITEPNTAFHKQAAACVVQLVAINTITVLVRKIATLLAGEATWLLEDRGLACVEHLPREGARL